MIIDVVYPKNLNKTGIYKIINTVNNKYYVGSTQESFIIRWCNHLQALRNKTHKNQHLQRAFNKYGEESFKFTIIELCSKTICLEREQVYLDIAMKENSYNINPLATTLCNNEETINKQIKSRKKYYTKMLPFYEQVKNKEITIEEVPIEFQDRIKSYLNHVPWNKGKHYESTDHLKVKHKKSDRSNVKNTVRNKQKPIYVYDSEFNFIDSFRSSKDLEELSLKLVLPVKSRFMGDRMGVPACFLNSGNITKAVKTNTTYKGLHFFNEPLHPGMDDVNEPKSVNVWNDSAEVN